jgi:hypothetical protein
MAFPLQVLMGELSYQTVEIASAPPVPRRRAAPVKSKLSRWAATPRGQPAVYWWPVAASGLVTLTLMIAVAVTARSGRAASPTELSPAMALAPALDAAAQPPEAPPPLAPESVWADPARAPLPLPDSPLLQLPRGSGCSVPSPAWSSRIPNLLVDLDAGSTATCSTGNFGTALEFARNPSEAAKIAKRQQKLTFLLHVSGNFEDDDFT